MSRAPQRTGSVLVTVLACAAVATMIVMSTIQISLRQRRQLRKEYQLEQTRWVLDAAIRKSIQANDNDSNRELLELTPQLPKFESVKIKSNLDDTNDSVVVQVVVESAKQSSVTTRSARFNASQFKP